MRAQNPPKYYDPAYMARLVALVNQMLEAQTRRDVTFARVTITDLPTSATDLAPGTLWNDAGTVKVVT